jgi:voltage-gated potassium channel
MIKRKILYLLIVFSAIVFLSALLYRHFEGYSLLDAFYVTVITLTSLGYSRLYPATVNGKILTMVLALGGYTFLAAVITIVSSAILEGKLLESFRRKKMEKKIKGLKNHIIVCGGGDVGKYVIDELYTAKSDFVLIDKNSERIDELLKSYPGLYYTPGDATDDAVLEAAGIKSAAGILVVLPTDTENLYVIVTAKSLNKNIQVISHVVQDENQKKLMNAGAGRVISSNMIIGTRLASIMLRPSVVSFIDVVNKIGAKGSEKTLRIEEVKLPQRSSLVGKNIAYARIPQETGLIIIAISKMAGEIIYNPGSLYEFSKEDKLIVLGSDTQIEKLIKFVNN